MLDETFYSKLDALYRANDPDAAEQYLKTQLEYAWQDEFNHGDRATVLNELMSHYRVSGDYDRCDEARKALLREIRALGLSDGPVYATFMLNIANACRAMGRLDEAEASFIQVKDIYERELEPGDYRMASLCNNLGITYRAKGDLDQAKAYLEQALSIVENLPDTESAVAATCSNLADLLIEQGDLAGAAGYAHRAIRAYEEGGFAEGVDYSAALAAAARIEYRAERFARSAELYEAASQAVKQSFGETATYRTLIANRDEALACARRAEEEEPAD